MSVDPGKNILEIRNLTASYVTRKGKVTALKNVSLKVREGERLAIVGESGSGKSTLASIITRLEPKNLIVETGEVLYRGIDILRLNRKELRKIRGKEIATVFQNPSESLNPLYTVGNQIIEALRLEGLKNKVVLKNRAIALLQKVKIPTAERIFHSYPHELSGGQKQRVAIAIAISRSPRLIVADEPTTALDVSVQSRILELLVRLNEEGGATEILITHDIGVANDFADRVVVMYAGRIVEDGSTAEVIQNPLHPYTKHLLNSIPRTGELPPGTDETLVSEIPEKGCPYAPRCPKAIKNVCDRSEPPLKEVLGRRVACHAVN